MKVTELDILRVPCEVHVDTRGHFTVFLLGHAEEEDARALNSDVTMDGAIEGAKPEVRKRKKRVSVSFLTLRGEERTAVGIHAGTGNVLLADGSQWTRGYSRSNDALSGDMPREKVDEMVRLEREYKAAYDAVAKLQQEFGINLTKLVTEAMGESD